MISVVEPKPKQTDAKESPPILVRELPDDIWLPEVGTKVTNRTGWRWILAKWFLPYR